MLLGAETAVVPGLAEGENPEPFKRRKPDVVVSAPTATLSATALESFRISASLRAERRPLRGAA